MRIDAHQHFWDLSRFQYPWMPPEPSRLRKNYLPDDLRYHLRRNRFDGSVAVQATTDIAETEWLLSIADDNPFVLGVVGWVDLTSPAVGAVLDRLQRHARLCGVRHPVHDEPDPRWLLRDDVIDGLRQVARRSLPFDLLLRPEHLACVPELVDRVPDLSLVIDHIAKPPIASGQLEPWASQMSKLAAIPHLHVKISGLITEADWKTWLPSQLTPYVQHVWGCFGPERCLFGSDWPVCLQAGTWKETLAGFTQALGPIAKEIRAGVIGENAMRFYRLPEPQVTP